MDEIRVAVVGLGSRALRGWIPIMQRLRGYRITALCEQIPALQARAIETRPELAGIKMYTGYDDVLADSNVDAIALVVRAPDQGAMAARGIQLGHGGLIAIPRGTDWRALLEHWLEFFARESCGKCVPCALGSVRALELARREPGARGELEPLLELIADTSLCAFGQLVPAPVRAVLRRLAREEGAIE